MEFEVEFTDEFGGWWDGLTEAEQDSIDKSVGVLRKLGPALRRPRAGDIKGSKYPNMRELIIQHAGEPFRVLYAFNPERTAILLIGGNKTGDDRWYEVFVPLADKLYEQHLLELLQERKQ